MKKKKHIGKMLKIKLLKLNKSAKLYTDDKSLLRGISKLLTFEIPGAKYTNKYKYGFWDGKTTLLSSNNVFPMGLVPIVIEFAKNKYNVRINIVDNRIGNNDIKFECPTKLGDLTLRDYQYDIVNKVLNNSIDGVQFPRGIINAATNAGKSLIAAAICKSLKNKKCLFLTHRMEIFNQIRFWFTKYLDEDIGKYNSKEVSIKRVTVAMITTLYSRRSSPEIHRLLSDYDCIIVDEVHHATSESWKYIINKSKAFYKIGLSGTPLKLDDFTNVSLLGLFGPVVGKITNKDLVDMGYSASPRIIMLNYHQSDLSNLPSIENVEDDISKLNKLSHSKNVNSYNVDKVLNKLRRNLYLLVYENGIALSQGRADKLVGICEMHSGEQILVIVRKISHGTFLKDYLNSKGIKCVFVNGKTSDDKRIRIRNDFANGKIGILIATLIYKEGIDIPSIDVLVLAIGEKSPITILQTFGRGLRKRKDKNYVPVYDFNDISHKNLKIHTNLRKKIYKNEGFKVLEK